MFSLLNHEMLKETRTFTVLSGAGGCYSSYRPRNRAILSSVGSCVASASMPCLSPTLWFLLAFFCPFLLYSAPFLAVLPLVASPTFNFYTKISGRFGHCESGCFFLYKGTPVSHHKNDRKVCNCPRLFCSHCTYSIISTQYVLN